MCSYKIFISLCVILNGTVGRIRTSPLMPPVGNLEQKFLHPCEAHSIHQTTVDNTTSEEQDSLSLRSRKIKQFAQQMMDYYMEEIFSSPTFEEDTRFLSLPDLSPLPPFNKNALPKLKVLRESHAVYKFLATAVMFIEHSYVTKINDDDTLMGMLQHLQTELFSLMCSLSALIYECGGHLSRHTIENITTMSIPDSENNHSILIRDFLVLRELRDTSERTEHVFHHLHECAFETRRQSTHSLS